MILDAILIVMMSILFALLKVFQLITFAIPGEIQESVSYILGFFGFLKGIFPVDTMFQAFAIYIQFLLILYTWHIVKWTYAHIPWFGRHKELPKLHKK